MTELQVNPLLDDRAECRKHPHWYWFALPLTRKADGGGLSPSERRLAKVAHERALATCVACPIVAACAAHGMANEAHGIWGGLTEWERHALGGRGTGAPNNPAARPATAYAMAKARFGSRFTPLRNLLLSYKADVA